MVARGLLCSIIFGAMAGPVLSAPVPRPVQIEPAPLAESLRDLARQTGAELLFDQRIVQGARSPEVHGTMLPEQALSRLLAGTGIAYRRTPDGVFVLYAAAAAPLAAREPPVPEILIIGVRTQNSDIRRTRNDIQPYVISTGSDIENAHPDDLGQYFRNRISADAQTVAPAQNTLSNVGSVNSQIDLRGLGSLRTLVLVDGRRMPSLPTPQFDFGQADVNAIPLSAIDRVETLTGTAGGIYGPGAIGGVVNIVLRRNYRGADLRFVSGISSRGDARRLGFEGRIGFTPDGGRTDVMLFVARTTVEPLLSGDVDYRVRARRELYANNPSGYIANPPPSNAIGVFSQSGNLTLDPQFGGVSLESAVTYLPVGFSGSAADRTALLSANAGRLVFDLPHDASGTRRYVLSNPTVTSGILNVRHRFSSKFEAFFDALYFRDDGRFEGQGEPLSVVTAANAANNPFQQPVIFTFPNLGARGRVTTTLDIGRATTGVIADLGAWKGSADVTVGRAEIAQKSIFSESSFPFQISLRRGTLGLDGQPIVDPLGDWSRFVAATTELVDTTTNRSHQANHFGTASARLAGPIARLPGGAVNLTLLAERRWEHTPETLVDLSGSSFDRNFPLPVRRQLVDSGYAEMRAPIISSEAAGPARGLELQLAARYDRVRTIVPRVANPVTPTNDDLVAIVNSGVTFTAGARMFPLRPLMLRGSVATGELPPTIAQLATNEVTLAPSGQQGPFDPLRGNQRLGSEGPVTISRGGSHALVPEHATTFSIGAVLNPNGTRLPRISIDYSGIDVRREVSFFTEDLGTVVANESLYGNRIVRAPLTDADRALGFTAGRVLSIDLAAFNGGRTRVETVDTQFDWPISLGIRGTLRIYGNATWYTSFKGRRTPQSPWISRLDHIDGPLRWRGNVGAEWTRGPLMIGLNAQYFGHYRPTSVGAGASINAAIVADQGSSWIPSQAYVDLSVRHRFRLSGRPLRTFDLSFGLLNLLDKRPPLIVQTGLPGYSYYGDPRRRRFELVLSTGF